MGVEQQHYTCMHEKQIQNHSRLIEGLKARADYKDKKLDEFNDKMDKMEVKIDKLADSVNTLVLQSTKDDQDLELRLKAIETELAIQKQTSTTNHNRLSSLLAIVGVGLTIITIGINIIFHIY